MAFSSSTLSDSELKEYLDAKYSLYCRPDFLPHDPLGMVHQFTLPSDQEIFGLLMATIAWGNRVSILKSGEKLKQIMGDSPTEFVLNFTKKDLAKIKFVHRTFQTEDLLFFFNRLKENYMNNSSLELKFAPHPDHSGVKGRIISFREWFFTEDTSSRTQKHVANPLKNSAAKRLNMYLRWMCRTSAEGVDLGLWKSIPTYELCIPLDVHTGTVARNLGLLHRTQNDWKTVEELMSKLRTFDPIDPSKYDFALFGVGVNKEI